MNPYILSFLISYATGCIPTVKDVIVGKKSMYERLNIAFKKAIDRWDYSFCTKSAILQSMEDYLPKLKEYLTIPTKGRHPRENELLNLWAEEIMNDTECCQFIINTKSDATFSIVEENILIAKNILTEVDTLHSTIEALKRCMESISCPTSLQCDEHWKRWSSGKTITLSTKTVTSNRQDAIDEIYKCLNEPRYLKIKAVSTEEAFAFACASILEKEDNNVKRTVVVTSLSEYNTLIKLKSSLIIITNVSSNHQVAIGKGHSIIYCVSFNDVNFETGVVTLPEVDREEFINALRESGYDNSKARDEARNSGYDINILRRHICVSCPIPGWLIDKNQRVLIASCFLGEWNEDVEGDRELVSYLTRMSYEEVLSILQPLQYVDDTPVIKIGTIWRVKSTYDLMTYLFQSITSVDLNYIKGTLEIVNSDDDPDAVEKMEETDFQFRKYKQIFSSNIKEGLYNGIALYSVLNQSFGLPTKWTDKLVSDILSNYSIERYLSNKRYICSLAECSPISFIDFVKKDIESGSTIIHQLFIPREKKFSITGVEIFYTEMLHALECLAWDPEHLYNVTEFLFYMSKYPHDSKYANSPLNSLRQIYRLLLPQTTADFATRINILKSMGLRYPQEVYNLIRYTIKDLTLGYLMPNSTFRWRLRGCNHHASSIRLIPYNDLLDIIKVMFGLYSDSSKNFHDLIELSFDKNVNLVRNDILEVIYKYNESHVGDVDIYDFLRDKICHHKEYKNAVWSLSEDELQPYISLLKYIEPKDVVLKNKHFFEDCIINDPDYFIVEKNYEKMIGQYNHIRENILRELIHNEGIGIVYELEKVLKDKSYLAAALETLYDEELSSDIFEMFVSDEISADFIKNYFARLYIRKGEDKYLDLLHSLLAIDTNRFDVLLCAPNYQRRLALEANKISQDVATNYWQSVNVRDCDPNEVEFIVSNLRKVGRYDTIFSIVGHSNLVNSLSSDVKIDILFESLSNVDVFLKSDINYKVADILASIGMPSDQQQLNRLLLIEFLLFDILECYIDKKFYHLYIVLNNDYNLLIQLLQMIDGSDDETIEDCDRQRRFGMAEKACRFLFKYDVVPCTEEGIIDYVKLQSYLQNVLEARGSKPMCAYIIGKIIANIPEDEDYPSPELCKLVQFLENNHIDEEIGCGLFNKRGSFCISPFAGGERERNFIKLFENYRQRALPYSSRMVKIFDQLINGYKRDAEREDNNSKLLGLKY